MRRRGMQPDAATVSVGPRRHDGAGARNRGGTRGVWTRGLLRAGG